MEGKSFIDSLLEAPKVASRTYRMANYDGSLCLKRVCALLNGDGGFIIVGIDPNNKVVGISSEVVNAIKLDVSSLIRPLPLIYIKEEQYKGEVVALLTVMKGGLPPYTFNNKFYIVKGEECVEPSADETSIMLRDSRAQRISWESSVNLGASWDNFDYNCINEVVAYGKANKLIGNDIDSPEKLLSSLSLRDVNYIMNGAVALFDKNASSLLPQCKVRIQVMLNGKQSDIYQDTRIFKGNLFAILDNIHGYFVDRFPMISAFGKTNWDRKDGYLYPMDVLDEAVTNALIHRDYSFELDEVLIYIYNEKIEIINPGTMPSGMLKGKNKIMPHVSKPWNPLMAEVFHIGGKMEKTGRGLGLIYDGMSSLNRKLPEWSCESGMVKLTIYCKEAKKKENVRGLEFLNSFKGKIFSKADYLRFFEFSISDTSAKYDLQSLVTEGKCEKIGSGPSTKYRVR